MVGYKGLTSFPTGRGQLEQTEEALKDKARTDGKD